MSLATPWSGLAFNQVPDSDNRIHSDEIAQALGFTGALVPGVTQSAYLMHPAVEALGLDWLSRGFAHVRVQSPLYDEARFDVEISAADDYSYQAQLSSEGRVCASAEIALPPEAPPAPERQGHELMPGDYQAPPATRERFELLLREGCPARAFLWSAEHEMATYLRDQQAMPALLRTDGHAGSGGFANASFLLGVANRHFAAVAKMSPWIHMETHSQQFAPVALGTELISEMRVVELFARKGHEFADCDFNLFRADTDECVFTVRQRAIYRVRGA
jgi:hypothetical protein